MLIFFLNHINFYMSHQVVIAPCNTHKDVKVNLVKNKKVVSFPKKKKSQKGSENVKC